ncbi:MAG: flagellar hook-associated protein, partial [Phototrophicales bacterium]
FGLDLTSLDKGNDALAFYGSTDPASAVLLTSSTNTLDNVISGVSIDLTGTSSDPVTVNVTRDNDKIISSIKTFIDAYNTLVDRIAYVTRYDPETEVKGTLLGDSLVSNLRASLGQTALANPIGVDDEYD